MKPCQSRGKTQRGKNGLDVLSYRWSGRCRPQASVAFVTREQYRSQSLAHFWFESSNSKQSLATLKNTFALRLEKRTRTEHVQLVGEGVKLTKETYFKQTACLETPNRAAKFSCSMKTRTTTHCIWLTARCLTCLAGGRLPTIMLSV
ncbi:hypothetical protein M514_08134 [Trichuris suis]|uniref:Uncharacterized protein n=1 Tax=Trichuris suis TaxID=68888 RepID=A0A085M156_9BILA|nr:hypothetical protein M513_08134 [Trichuris suis]KFD71877.1 hypothetical protein M514_08134 [Trichuris suis]